MYRPEPVTSRLSQLRRSVKEDAFQGVREDSAVTFECSLFLDWVGHCWDWVGL